jgi:hypothetical protein
MRTRRLPFCVILPLFSVCIWILFVVLPVSFGYLHLIHLANGSPSVFLHNQNFSITVPANNFFRFTANMVGESKGWKLTAVNLPGFVLELLLSIRTWPSTWQPAGFTLWAWRALSLPIFARPAWYYAGIGIDGLLGRIVLHMRDAIFGSMLSAACAILGAGLTVGLSAADREPSLKWITAGFLLWAMLFGTVAVAAVRQGRPKAAIFMQVLSGLVFGVTILWAWTNSPIPLWEVSNPDGSYSIGWRSGIVTLCVAVAAQLLSRLMFRKFTKRTDAPVVGENPA